MTRAITLQTVADLRAHKPGTLLSAMTLNVAGSDRIPGEWYWDATSTSADDGALTLQVTGVVVGRWRRVWDGINLQAAWFLGALPAPAAPNPGGSDPFVAAPNKTSAMLAIIAACEEDRTVVHFPAGIIKFTSELAMKRGVVFRGVGVDRTAGAGFSRKTQFVYDATDLNASAVWLKGKCVLEGIDFFPMSGKTIRSAVRHVNDTVNGITATGASIKTCSFYGKYAANQGDFTHFLILGEASAGNADEFLCEGCYFEHVADAAVWLAGGQPLGVTFRKCFWVGGTRAVYEGYGLYAGPQANRAGSWGSAFRITVLSTDLTVDGGTFSFMERGIEMLRTGAPTNYGGSPFFVNLIGVTSEVVRKLIYTNSVYVDDHTVVKVIGGRHALTARLESVNHSATDSDVITFERGGVFTNHGHIQTVEPVQGTGFIRVGQLTHVDGSGFWPSQKFLRRTISNPAMDRGTCYARGLASAPNLVADTFGNTKRQVRYDGTDEPSGDYVISGEASSFRLPFSTPLKSNFHIKLLPPTVESGSPTSGSLQVPTVTARSSSGVTITLGAAPGTGASVRIPYEITPGASAGSDGAVPSYEIITDTSTFRGTAAPGGILGHSTNGVFVTALVYVPSGSPQGGHVLADNGHSGTTGWSLYRDFNGTQPVRFMCGSAVSPDWTIPTGDLDKTHVITGTWDPTNGARLFVNGTLVSGAATAGTFTPSTAATRVGSVQYVAANRAGILAVCGGDTAVSIAEAATQYAATSAAGSLQVVPAKTDHLWLLTGAATVEDAIGADDITATAGSGLTVGAVVPAFVV